MTDDERRSAYGYELASEYWPGLEYDDFLQFMAEHQLASLDWDDIVGWEGEPDPNDVRRYYHESWGNVLYKLRDVGPPDSWCADHHRANCIWQHLIHGGCESVLDFGGGNGSAALWLARKGLAVGYVDVGRIAEFARWRFKREGLLAPRSRRPQPGKIITRWSLDYLIFAAKVAGQPWDAICAVDVLEHIPNPIPIVQAIYDGLRPGGLFIFTPVSFKPLATHPMHLESTFWLQERSYDVLAEMGFELFGERDTHHGIGSWRKPPLATAQSGVSAATAPQARPSVPPD